MSNRVEKVDVIRSFIIITCTSQLYSPSPGTFPPWPLKKANARPSKDSNFMAKFNFIAPYVFNGDYKFVCRTKLCWMKLRIILQLHMYKYTDYRVQRFKFVRYCSLIFLGLDSLLSSITVPLLYINVTSFKKHFKI